MNWTILIPHYKTGKMTAYAVSRLLKSKGKHKVRIIVIDNSNGDGMEYLERFGKQITIRCYPPDKIQSHGLAFDYVLPEVRTDYFITVESDSFPTQENWLDYYEDLVNKGFDCAGSLLKLSGGTYIHPCGAMYKTSVWKEAKDYISSQKLFVYPNAKIEPEFKYHLISPDQIPQLEKSRLLYSPISDSVFHNLIGSTQEHLHTYGNRNMQYNDFDPITQPVQRVGHEPGQWFSYWMAANNKSIYPIPTEIKWLPGRVNQQQEYTIMENGFKHLWGVTAYHKSDLQDRMDIINFKKQQMEELWESINT